MEKTKSSIEEFHGQIINFDIWNRYHSCFQINIIALRLEGAKNMLRANLVDEELIHQMKIGQLIILNHRKEINAIVKDTENNFRFIK